MNRLGIIAGVVVAVALVSGLSLYSSLLYGLKLEESQRFLEHRSGLRPGPLFAPGHDLGLAGRDAKLKHRLQLYPRSLSPTLATWSPRAAALRPSAQTGRPTPSRAPSAAAWMMRSFSTVSPKPHPSLGARGARYCGVPNDDCPPHHRSTGATSRRPTGRCRS